MTSLAGSGLKMEEDHLNLKMVTVLLFTCLNITYLNGNMCHENNTLKIYPIGMATFKKVLPLGFQTLNYSPVSIQKCSDLKHFCAGMRGAKNMISE